MILVSGLLNIETTLRVDEIPLVYEPVRYPFFGINSTVSGVGYNLTKALHTLGAKVNLLSLVGQDAASEMVRQTLLGDDLPGVYVLPTLSHTPQSVIVYEGNGRRMIFTDLKDIQEHTYPMELFERALRQCELAMLCNVNFSRPFLARAKQAGKPIATDVHTIRDLDDAYNQEFMAAANILFMSHEHLPCAPEEWARRVQARYGTPIVVIGMGSAGAVLAVREHGFVERIPGVYTRPVVSTVGAGDALFSAFNFVLAQTGNPYEAIEKAMVFASYKVGAVGAAEGFLTAVDLQAWCNCLQETRDDQ